VAVSSCGSLPGALPVVLGGLQEVAGAGEEPAGDRGGGGLLAAAGGDGLVGVGEVGMPLGGLGLPRT
jgi:hypothetical protein